MIEYLTVNHNQISIKCKLYKKGLGKPETAVICCHGFGCDKEDEDFELLSEKLPGGFRGTWVLTLDLPCHGKDGADRLSLDLCREYVDAAAEYALSRLGAKRLCAAGVSFGGMVLLDYISCHPERFDRIVLRCPAINMYDVLTGIIMTRDELRRMSLQEYVSVGFETKVRITEDFVKELEARSVGDADLRGSAGKILIIHGTEDELIPFAMAERFAGDHGMGFVKAVGADHRFLDKRALESAISAEAEFLTGG